MSVWKYIIMHTVLYLPTSTKDPIFFILLCLYCQLKNRGGIPSYISVWERFPQAKKFKKRCVIRINGIAKKWNNSLQQSASWRANSSSASQELLRVVWHPNVHCRVHNSPAHIHILSQTNAVRAVTVYIAKTNKKWKLNKLAQYIGGINRKW